MYKLGTVIRDRLETLAAEYERWLRENEDYARMPAETRRDAARLMLSLVASWLDAGDGDSFVQFIHTRAQERAEQGFEMDALLHALNGLEETLLPLVDDVETAKFLWHSTAQARVVISNIVTERARASERRSRQLIERVSLGIFRTTPEGRVAEANPAFFEIVGYDSIEAVNRVGVSALYENSIDRERLLASLRQGPVSNYETRFRRGDGRVISVSINVRSVEAEGVRVLEGILADITERKRAEVALLASEERFRALVTNLGEGVASVDVNELFTFANPAAENIFGVPAGGLVGRNLQEFTTPEQFAATRRQTERRQVGATSTYELEIARPDGEKRDLLVTVTPQLDSRGQFMGGFGVFAEITERKRVEEALRESEERFHRFSDVTAEGLVFHEQGKIIDVNAALMTLFGYSDASELVGKNLMEFIAPEARAAVVKQLQSGSPLPYEAVAIRKDGSTFPVEAAGRLYEYQGRTIRVGSIRDITERKQAEAALRESEERMRLLIEQAGDAIFIENENDDILDVNDRACKLLGYSREELLKMKVPDLQAPEVRRQAGNVVKGELPLGNHVFEGLDLHRDGTRIPVEISTTRIVGREGGLVLSIVRDIRERKRAEAALRQSEASYRQLYDSFTDGLASVSMEGYVTECNSAFEKMVGYGIEELRTIKFQDLTPAKWHAREAKILTEQALTRGYTDLYEKEYIRKDGTVFPVELAVYTTKDEAGNPIGFWGFIRDITERKRLEQQIQESLARRGYQVQVSTQVAQEIAAAPALEELYRRVVTLIKERFNYYHAQIFRDDPAQDAVVLVVGYGKAGEKMLAAGHKLTMGRGVVGTAAATGRSMLATDVTQDKDWRPNPNLPATKGELAVPIKLRDEVLGILDVQSDRVGALTADDQLLLEGLCGQIAVAIESTRLFQQARESAAQLQQALDIARLAYWEFDFPSQSFTFNDQFYALTRTTAEQVGGYILPAAEYLRRFVHPEDAALIVNEIQQAAQAARPDYRGQVEYRVIRGDGQIQYAFVEYRLLLDDQNRALKGYGAHLDITERKQAEAKTQETLRELERLYRATTREGWQAFREATETPSGYLFDRTSVQPADAKRVWTPVIEQAIKQNALVPPTGEEAVAVAPLSVRGEVIGAVGVYDDPQHPLTSDELELIEQISEQGALALEAARLFEEARTRAEEMAALNELSQRLTARLDEAGMLEETWRGVARLMDATNFSVALYDEDRDEISFPLDIADGKSTGESATLPSSRGMTGYIIRNRQPVLIKENAAKWRAERGIESIGSRLGALSWLGVPMIIGDRVLGVLTVQSYTAQRAYNEHDQDMLVAIASQAAIALQSARQFDLAQTRAGREQMLRQVLAVVNASQDLAASLPEIEGHLRALVPLDTLAMAMYTAGDPDYTIFAFRPDVEGGRRDHVTLQKTRLPIRGTTSGWVITQKQPRLDADLRQEKSFMEDEALAAAGMVSRLVLPLKLGDQVIGTLNLASAQPGTYTEEHVSILQPLIEQMTLALERARLLEETRAALAEVEATQRRYLREKWESYLAGAAEAPTGYMDGPTGLVPTGETRLPEQALSDNVLSVPLKLRGEPIGVLEFYHEDATRAWSEDERALVEALADQAALALENARLLDETQSRAQREQLINEITARIRASMDMETILQTTTEELSKALNLSRARIRLTADEGDGREK